ncbi:DUF418 domain-containing protein [Salinicoccus sp. ID82-1]|nr:MULTISPECIES: DUF418 domain-containing protein [Salinicoccus]MCG1010539.1 DUF418 domain-containing protein [Salinicoccus sp. ID82-1]
MKRIEAVDAIRGFSLFGIFMANLLIFQYGLTGKDHLEYFELHPLNEGILKGVKIIFESSFLPIFAILFGFSLDRLFQSMKRKQVKLKRIKLYMRAFTLIAFGLLHSYFIWEGDILLAYGIAMLFIIPFIGLGKRFFKWVTTLSISAALLITSLAVFAPAEEVPAPNDVDMQGYLKELKFAYGEGTYANAYQARNHLEDPYITEIVSYLEGAGIILLIAGLLMPIFYYNIGIYLSKSDWFSKNSNRLLSANLFIFLIPVSIFMKSSIIWMDNKDLASMLHIFFGSVLSFGLIVLIRNLHTKYRQNFIFIGFRSMGKLSLTMYIMQSLIATTLFYGYGLGWFGRDIFGQAVIIFLLVYVFQMFLATWYTSKFRYGPLEYLLRVATYFHPKARQWHFKKEKTSV